MTLRMKKKAFSSGHFDSGLTIKYIVIALLNAITTDGCWMLDAGPHVLGDTSKAIRKTRPCKEERVPN